MNDINEQNNFGNSPENSEKESTASIPDFGVTWRVPDAAMEIPDQDSSSQPYNPSPPYQPPTHQPQPYESAPPHQPQPYQAQNYQNQPYNPPPHQPVPYQPPQYQPPPNTYYQQPPAQQFPPVKLGEWLGALFLMCIPIANIVLMFVWAFDRDSNPSKQSFFRAYLIFTAVIFVISFVIAGMFFFVFAAVMHDLIQSYGGFFH